MSKQVIDQVKLRQILNSTHSSSLELALVLLEVVKNHLLNSQNLHRPIKVTDVTHTSFTISQLERALEVLKMVNSSIIVNHKAKAIVAKYGVLSVSKATGQLEIRDEELLIPPYYPTKVLLQGIKHELVRKENRIRKGDVIKIILNSKQGLVLNNQPSFRYRVYGKRLLLLSKLADEVSTRSAFSINDLKNEFSSPDSEFAAKDAIREINESCKEKLQLPTKLIINHKGFGYGIDWDRYHVKNMI